jgi:hypothetical protein
MSWGLEDKLQKIIFHMQMWRVEEERKKMCCISLSKYYKLMALFSSAQWVLGHATQVAKDVAAVLPVTSLSS